MELLDRVNEQDEVIGITYKEEAHEKGYLHRIAEVYVFDSQNRLLMQRRRDDNLLDNSVGGHVRSGEAYLDAARREMFEEIGLSAELVEIGKFYSDERTPLRDENFLHYSCFYEAKVGEHPPLKLEPEEVKEILPMTMDEIGKEVMARPDMFRVGFMKSFVFYSKQKGIELPDIKFV